MYRLKTLLNLLAYLASVLCIAPLFPYLERPVQAFLPAALLAGIICDRLDYYPLRRVPAAILSSCLFFFYAVGISREQMVHSVVHIIVLLLAVRLVTEKSSRNYLQLFVLAVFALAGSTLLDLSALFLFCLILLVLAVTVGLVLLTFHSADADLRLTLPELRRILATALVLPAVSLVLMLGFFVILPRTNHPLWNFLNPTPAAASTAGISDRIEPGDVASMGENSAIAFRAEGEDLPAEERYWRGTVLNTMEGNTWVRHEPPTREKVRLAGGRPITQTIYPEPKTDRLLVALDPPEKLDGVRFQASADMVHTARRPLVQRTRYAVDSRLGGKIQLLGAADREFYQQPPASVAPRLRSLAERIAAEGRSDRHRVDLLREFFLAQKLAYATSDLPGSENSAEEFLFEKKRGYCEHFASSFGLLLRLVGVPARLVGGYHGGEYNALAGYYLVKESAAHVWVEALVEGNWMRIDPTGWAQNPEALPRHEFGAWRQLLDAFDYYWTRAVITYDLGSQIGLLRQANFQMRDWRWPRLPAPAWPVFAGLLLLSTLLLLLRRRRNRDRGLPDALRQRVRAKYALGPIPLSQGLLELAIQVDDPLCREFAEIYNRAAFRDRPLRSVERRRLRQLLRELAK
ncbi:MAG: DUF3488 and transglutaminase-like domain-containing protein [Desulfuromonadales bacterium]